MYEVLVTASLTGRGVQGIELDAKYNYLSEFAYHLFSDKKRSLPQEKLVDWHQHYCREYKITLDFPVMMDELVETRVVENRHGEFRFRYKYLFYFFVARYFRDHINEDKIQEHIKYLSHRLYHEQSANIIIFLCHLSKDDRVLHSILESARGLFTNVPEYNVTAESPFLSKLDAELPKLVLKSGDPGDNRRKLLEARDEVERAKDKNKEDLREISEPESEMTPLLQLNAALKTIQILGQVLKNFSGSLKGEPKRQLVEECYSLGLRVLGSIFKVAEEKLPSLVEAMTGYANSQPKPPAPDKLEAFLRRAFFGLMQAVAFSVFKHVSKSVGTEKVAQTFKEVASDVENPSVKIIDLSIRLDHYRQFPQAQIEELAREFASDFFAMCLVRFMVWYHLYLFPVDYQQKQRACQKLEISLEQQTRLLAQGPKKTTFRRGRDRKR